MLEYPTHTWESVVDFFRQLADANPAFAPMGAAVEQLATSPYAAGLYPVQSMHTLRLYQQERAGPTDEELRLDFEDGAFVVCHRAGETPDPRFTLRAPPGVWTKRGPDAIVLLERAFHHLRWFVEYRGVVPDGPHHDPAV